MGRDVGARPGWVESGARVSYVVMGVGAVCVGALALGLLGPLADTAFLILGAGAVAATLVGLRRNRPAARWPWMIIAARARRVPRRWRCPRGVRHPRRSLLRSFARAGSHHVVGLRDPRHWRARPGERPPPGSPRYRRDARRRHRRPRRNGTRLDLPHQPHAVPRTSATTRAVPPLVLSAAVCLHRRDDCATRVQHREAPPVVVRPPPGGGDGNARRGHRLHAPRDPRGDAAPARVRRPLRARFCSVHRRRAPSVDARAHGAPPCGRIGSDEGKARVRRGCAGSSQR